MYLNEAQISLTGYVATQPQVRTTPSGALNVSMRVAWTPRRQDRATGEWADGNTSYVTVICWRKLASNAGVCLRKGDPVVVKGRLSIREFDDKQGVRRTAVEVEASSVGHDLSRGVAQFQRVRPQTGMTAVEYAAAQANADIPGGTGNGANGLAAADGSAAANGQPANGLTAGADDVPMLEVTENGFSVPPEPLDDGFEPDGARPEQLVSDESVDRFLGEAAEGEQSRDLEPVGAPF
ncbi:MAG TPA: single-stranded DNA-binding protein [Streptosporangiaceae bacterium]|jgi:single-strand DNA-binding protein|nr:single-stranded DNA-binding protein [Streptosporangiaceae bacterium]